MALNEQLGLKKNPFSLKSSEQELAFLEKIFFEPNYYKTLVSDLSSGVSRIIIGQRGAGKSSIINKLLTDLEEQNILTIKIDRFDSIPIRKNETAFIRLMLREIVTKLAIYLDKNPAQVKKLDKTDKEKLSLFIRIFFKTLSKSEYSNIYDNIHKVKVINFFIRFFNKWGVGVANSATSTAISITSTIIRQSIGFEHIDTKDVYKEYFGVVSEIDFDKIDFEKQNYTKDVLKQILDEFLKFLDLAPDTHLFYQIIRLS